MNIFNKRPFLIADIGFNFFDIAQKEGISDIDAAKLMIDEAKSCGVDAVMFQSYSLKNIISQNAPAYWDLSDEPIDSQFELFKKFDKFGRDDFKQLSDYCNDVGIMFLSTPYDFEAVDYLDEFMDVYAISSSDITNIPFIEYIASKNKPILLSTGASTLKEIKDAIDAIEEVSTVDIAILHCVLSHPTFYEDANLLMIKDLAKNFPDYDHAHAMDVDDVLKFKDNLNFLSKISGRINKQPLICESATRKEIRRSVVAKKDIAKGIVIEITDIAFKRPGTGISPTDVGDVIGKVATVDILEDTLIDFEMLQ